MRIERGWLYAAGLAVMMAGAVGCSSDAESKAGEGEACQVDNDCASGLLCRGEVCIVSGVQPDAGGIDGGGGDGGGSGNNENNAIEPEDYRISFILENGADETNLFVIDPAMPDDITRVNPEAVDCRLGCWLSEDMGTFVWLSGTGTFDIHTAPVDASLVVDMASEEVLTTGTQGVEVVGNVVTYFKVAGEDTIAYYRDLDGGEEKPVGHIGKTTATQGDWFVDPGTGRAVVYNATLQTMDVLVGEMGASVDEVNYTIDSSNYQMVAGSYFGGEVPTAISEDGRYMALITDSAPMDYDRCETAADCSGPGQRCGQFKRCSAIEVVVHFFDLEALDNLGGPCSDDSACGPVHTCDIPSELAIDQAVCIPRRVTLGLPGALTQQGKTGCELTSSLDDYFYTDIRGPLSFAGDHAYVVAGRDCAQSNMEITDIVRLSPTSSEVEVALGNPMRLGYDESQCYDPAEEAFTPDAEGCNVYIDRAITSPEGNEVVFVATNPETLDAARAHRDLDLWVAKRDGTERRWIGRHKTFDEEVVKKVWVHPAP